MQNAFLLTIVNTKSRKPDFQVKLPFLPRIGDDILFGGMNITVLKVSIQAEGITIATPQEDKMIIPGKPIINQDPEVLTPVVIFADIQSIEDVKSHDKGDNNANEKDKKIIQQ